MSKIINLEEYKKSKPVSENELKVYYDYFYEMIDLNIEPIEEALNDVKCIEEFESFINQVSYQMLAMMLSSASKDEILQVVENGNVFAFDSMIKDVLTDYPVIQKAYLNLKK